MILHQVLAYVKAEAVAITVGTGIVAGISLMGNSVTAPKMLAVMVFLSDWNMLGTWQWWTRNLFYLALIIGGWWVQRRQFAKRLLIRELAWRSEVATETEKVRYLQGEVKHMQLRLDILDRKK